jgi:hypothetical protein
MGILRNIQAYKNIYMRGKYGNIGRPGLIRQFVYIWEEVASLSTFKVALVLVYLYLLVLGHVTALVQNR